MTDTMAVIVPTRGRPQNVHRLEEARYGTQEVDLTRVPFVYVVDDDDPKVMDYARLADSFGPGSRLDIVHRRRLGPTLNDASARYLLEYNAIGFMGDDHLPSTRGWDSVILNALGDDQPNIVYGNDLLQGPNLPTAVFMPSKVIHAVGFMCPPNQVHLYLDNFWKMLGTALDTLTYLPGVIIEHVHPAAGKAEMDAGYQEANAPAQDQADKTAWLRFLDDPTGFGAAVDRVRQAYAR